MTETEFEQLATKAFESVPETFRKRMVNVALCVEEFDAEDPDLLGVYEGVSLIERGPDPTGTLPDKITLFRRTILEEAADSGKSVYDVIRETLIHEIAHHFGYDDEQIEEIFESKWEKR